MVIGHTFFLSVFCNIYYLEFSLGAQVEYICTCKQKIYEKLPTTHDSLLFKAYANRITVKLSYVQYSVNTYYMYKIKMF